MRLVLATGPAKASDLQVVEFLRYALARGIDTTATYVAERRGQLLAAALPVPSEGRTMLLLAPPYFATGEHRAAFEMLLEHVMGVYAGQGTQLAQVLLDPSDGEAIELYGAHGFGRLAELLYLQTTVRRAAAVPPVLPGGCGWRTYSDQTHALFARTIAATYERSLDCPALAGKRDIEDVVAGHRAAGEFRPELWCLLVGEGEGTLGVVLLAPAPPTDSMELVYLGLPPGARGRDLGDLLMRQALYATHAYGLPRLTLAVDATNGPALKLYYRHGLRRVHSKVALMRDLGPRVVHTSSTRPIKL
jgi:ribosomal protein S18 acetylase RimI-like enzyme